MSLTLVPIAGCATEPKLNDDYATYEVSPDPIPLSPIPGADIAAWTEAIDALYVGAWSSSGDLMTDEYAPARAEPVEDPRVEAERHSWVMEEGEPAYPEPDWTFAARAVTDADEGVLSIYCATDYDIRAKDLDGSVMPLPFEEVRRVMQGCMSGSGNDAIGSDELSAWLDEQIDAAEAAYEADKALYRFQVSNVIDATNVLVWFDSNEFQTSVSLVVDSHEEVGPP